MKRKGFTLIELLVVIGILTVLGIILVPIFANQLSRGKSTKESAEAVLIQMAAKEFVINEGKALGDGDYNSSVIPLADICDQGYLKQTTCDNCEGHVKWELHDGDFVYTFVGTCK